MKNIQIIIVGKVYKTGFRYFVKQMSERNGITGTVQYTDDHSVKIEARGYEDALNRFINYCRLGCLGSEVNNVSISESPEFPYRSFEIVNEEEKQKTKRIKINQ